MTSTKTYKTVLLSKGIICALIICSACSNNQSSPVIDIHEHSNSIQETKDSIEKYINISNNKLPSSCKYSFGEAYETVFNAEKDNNAQNIGKENDYSRVLVKHTNNNSTEYEIYYFLSNKLVSICFFEESYAPNLSRNYYAFKEKCTLFTKQKGYCQQHQKIDKRKSDNKNDKNIDLAALNGEFVEYCQWKYDSFDFSVVFQQINIGEQSIVAVIEHYQDVRAILNYYNPMVSNLADSIRTKTKAKVIQVKPGQPIYLDQITK